MFLHHLGHHGIRSPALAIGSYLTDGRRLFRVAFHFTAAPDHPLVALENCATLEVRHYLPNELGAMGLHRVQAQDAVSASAPKPLTHAEPATVQSRLDGPTRSAA